MTGHQLDNLVAGQKVYWSYTGLELTVTEVVRQFDPLSRRHEITSVWLKVGDVPPIQIHRDQLQREFGIVTAEAVA